MLKAPIELIKGYNPIDPLKRKIYWTQEEKHKSIDKKEESRAAKNKKRLTDFEFKVGNYVLKKNNKMKDKLEECFNGPHKIISIRKNSVLLDIGKKGSWFNIKNIKPFKGEEDVVVSYPTCF